MHDCSQSKALSKHEKEKGGLKRGWKRTAWNQQSVFNNRQELQVKIMWSRVVCGRKIGMYQEHEDSKEEKVIFLMRIQAIKEGRYSARTLFCSFHLFAVALAQPFVSAKLVAETTVVFLWAKVKDFSHHYQAMNIMSTSTNEWKFKI